MDYPYNPSYINEKMTILEQLNAIKKHLVEYPIEYRIISNINELKEDERIVGIQFRVNANGFAGTNNFLLPKLSPLAGEYFSTYTNAFSCVSYNGKFGCIFCSFNLHGDEFGIKRIDVLTRKGWVIKEDNTFETIANDNVQYEFEYYLVRKI